MQAGKVPFAWHCVTAVIRIILDGPIIIFEKRISQKPMLWHLTRSLTCARKIHVRFA